VERATRVAMPINFCNFCFPSTATLLYKCLRAETGSESLAFHPERRESACYRRLTHWYAMRMWRETAVTDSSGDVSVRVQR
jgi:hypothetical protein